MSFTAFTNIITILFCVAVLIQSVRMMRSLKQVREGQLDRTVGALETATLKAHGVLSDLKQTLSIEGTANSLALAEARNVREELQVMIGIANAMAERLMEAASSGSRADAAPATEPAKKPRAQTARSRSGAAQRTSAKPSRMAGPKAGATKTATGKTATAKAATKSVPSGNDVACAPRRSTVKKSGARNTRNTSELLLDAKELA